MKKKIILFAVAALAVAGFVGKYSYDYYSFDKQIEKAANTVVDVEAIKKDPKTVKLKKKELKEIERIFSTEEYNGFYRCQFNKVDTINWNVVLSGGAGICDYEAASGKRELYRENVDNSSYEDRHRRYLAIEKEQLEKYIYQKTGCNLEDIKDSLNWVYNEKYDIYLNDDDYEYEPVECISGIRNGNIYVVEMQRVYQDEEHYYKNPNREIVLIKTPSGYVVKSNRKKWETASGEEKNFDIDLPQFGGEARAITYKRVDMSDNFDAANVVLAGENDNYYEKVLTCNYDTEEFCEEIFLSDIDEVANFDVNGDGLQDIIVVGPDQENNINVVVFVCEISDVDDYKFTADTATIVEIMKCMDEDITIDNIKKFLTANRNEKFGSWQHAYKQALKVYKPHYPEFSQDYVNMDFSLAYVDGDDVPELIIHDPYINYVSIYSYKDGVLKNWAWELEYGNTIKYSPGKNLVVCEGKDGFNPEQKSYYHISEDRLQKIEDATSLEGDDKLEVMECKYDCDRMLEILDGDQE